jgi:uncharacterized protein YndB with AHSA1/START domain
MKRDPTPLARVAHRFEISPERLFDAWLNPDVISCWMFGPNVRDEQIVRLAVDLRVGGNFSFVVRRQSTEIEHAGIYKEIERPRRLVFTWGAVVGRKSDGESVITVDIRPDEKGTKLVLTHELAPSWANFAEQAAHAWTKMLDALSRHVAYPPQRQAAPASLISSTHLVRISDRSGT